MVIASIGDTGYAKELIYKGLLDVWFYYVIALPGNCFDSK